MDDLSSAPGICFKRTRDVVGTGSCQRSKERRHSHARVDRWMTCSSRWINTFQPSFGMRQHHKGVRLMLLSPRIKLIASACAVVTAGVIGCHLDRTPQMPDHAPRSVAPEAPRHLEPLPQPILPEPALVSPPQALVPPVEDESAVPSAGLSPIQRMCFTSSCSTCCPSTCAPCCSQPGLLSRMVSNANGWHHQTKNFFRSLNPFGGGCSSCSSCDPCCSPCVSCCDPCGGVIHEGVVVSDVTMGCGPTCGPSCGPWAPSGCGANAGVWAPSGPMYYPQPYQQVPMQAPCNCQRGQAMMQPATWGGMPPQGYAQYPQYPQQPMAVPQYQPAYAQPQMVPAQPQHSYVSPAPASQPMASPGHSQPNYTPPMAVAPNAGN